MFGYRIKDVVNSDIFDKETINKIFSDNLVSLEKPLLGAIFWTDLGTERTGSVQSGKRPCIVFNNFDGVPDVTTSIITPVTSKKKKYSPVHFIIKHTPINGLSVDSTVLTEQSRSIENSLLLSPLGMLTFEEYMNLCKAFEIQCPFFHIPEGETFNNLKKWFSIILKLIDNNNN